MTEPERRAAELRTLLARLSHQREAVHRIERRLEGAESRAESGRDPDSVAAVALFLQHFYTGIEDALLRLADELDGTVPAGDEWHRLVLEQLTLEIPGIRPALLGADLRKALDVLRRFRHRVRHAYDEDYDWEKMTGPREARGRASALMPVFFSRTEEVIGAIIQGLESL